MIHFILPITPQSGQFGKRCVVMPNGKPRWFNDSKKENYQATVALLAQQYRPPVPLSGALRVDFVFVMSRPKCLSRAKDPDGLIPCPKRPDRDNIQKGTQDGLSRCGFWSDDAQIFDGRSTKYYAERGGSPRIEVTIFETVELTLSTDAAGGKKRR